MMNSLKTWLILNHYAVDPGAGGGAPAGEPSAPAPTPAPTPEPAPAPAPEPTPAPAPTGGEDATLTAEAVKDLLTPDEPEGAESGEVLDEAAQAPSTPPKKDETPSKVETPPAAATPPTPPAPTPPPPAAAAPEPPKPPEPAPAPAPAAPEPPKPQPTEAELAKKMQEDEAKFDAELSKLYALDEATADKFLTEPQVVVPSLAAKLHKEVLRAAVNGILAEVPRVIEAYHERREASARNEKAFFDAWPQLKDHRNTVLSYLTVYRQSNPMADLQTTIRDVGAMASVALRIPVPGTPAAAPTPPPPAPAPSPAFQPALPGGGGRPVTQPQPKTGFEALVEEVIADGERT